MDAPRKDASAVQVMNFDREPVEDDEDARDVLVAPFSMNPIGYMESPLRKNGSPRQGSLVGHVRGRLTVSSGTGNNEHHVSGSLLFHFFFSSISAHRRRL